MHGDLIGTFRCDDMDIHNPAVDCNISRGDCYHNNINLIHEADKPPKPVVRKRVGMD